MATYNLLAGWIGMLGGVVSGAVIGLYFHKDGWFGGYSSFGRRMLRLGHISFFGLGFLNLFFALTADKLGLPQPYLKIASIALIVGAITMPTCCFLSAWRKPFRHLFPIPAFAVLMGIVSLLVGWPAA
jgi:hypothetical protein